MNRMNGTPLIEFGEDNERYAVYLAKMPLPAVGITATTEVPVKFTTRYNENSHRLLSEHGPPLAPTLYFRGRVVGDTYMVVMEYLSTTSPLNSSLPPSSIPRQINSEVVRKRLYTEALDLFRERTALLATSCGSISFILTSRIKFFLLTLTLTGFTTSHTPLPMDL